MCIKKIKKKKEVSCKKEAGGDAKHFYFSIFTWPNIIMFWVFTHPQSLFENAVYNSKLVLGDHSW